MGGSHSRRRHGNHNNSSQGPSPQAPPPPPPAEINANRLVFAAATPYPPSYPNPSPPQYYPPYPGYYQPPAPHIPLHAPFDHHHRGAHAAPYPCGPVQVQATPFVEHQKAVTIRNDVNLKKETLRVEPDEEIPGKYLVAFTFDATVAGR